MKLYFKQKKYFWIIFLSSSLIILILLLARIRPTLGVYYYMMANRRITSGKLNDGEKYMLKLYNLYPNNATVNQLMGDFHFHNTQNFSKAIFFYEKQLSSVYDAESMHNLCLSHDYLNHIEDSINCRMEYIKISGGDYETYFYLGMLFYRVQLFDEALFYVQKSYAEKPDCRSAGYLVELHYLNLHFSEARKSCEKLEFCTKEDLKAYPLEDFVFELCFDGDTHGN